MLSNLFSPGKNQVKLGQRGGGPGGGGAGASMQPRGSSHADHVFNLPPKKVVKSIMDYTAQYAQELSFKKGDFFYVINDDNIAYYEVINPIARVRGLVPTSHFENLDKVANTGGDGDRRVTVPSSGYDPNSGGGPPSPHYTRSAPPQARGMDVPPGAIAPRTHPLSAGGRRPSGDSIVGGGISGMNRVASKIVSAIVQHVELRPDGQFWFTVEVKREDESRHVLFRVYDDFWALQVALLSTLPTESGRKSSPRVIPFLPAPTRDMTPGVAHQRRLALDIYLHELLQLPRPVEDSFPMKRFFMVRKGDIETPINIKFDVSTTLMDLISDYNENAMVKVKLSLGDEMVAWRVPETVTYDELLDDVEAKIGMHVQGLAYKDETGALIELKGDRDLGLLVRTNAQKLIFYVR
ncbi:bud emergence protein 1 [Borealophlyctis nickersoniae]|nr:bud emergence protein 1 [Borealophlyctis nickersoniae]